MKSQRYGNYGIVFEVEVDVSHSADSKLEVRFMASRLKTHLFLMFVSKCLYVNGCWYCCTVCNNLCWVTVVFSLVRGWR